MPKESLFKLPQNTEDYNVKYLPALLNPHAEPALEFTPASPLLRASWDILHAYTNTRVHALFCTQRYQNIDLHCALPLKSNPVFLRAR